MRVGSIGEDSGGGEESDDDIMEIKCVKKNKKTIDVTIAIFNIPAKIVNDNWRNEIRGR